MPITLLAVISLAWLIWGRERPQARRVRTVSDRGKVPRGQTMTWKKPTA
jgi:hypothetical protein